MDIFEQASRLKLRFPSVKGLLTTEDLWSLPLRSETNRANLNDIAKDLNKVVRSTEEEDFVKVVGRVSVPNGAALSLEIVKQVISVRETENAAATAVQERKAQKQTLLALLEQKKTEALGGLSMEDLQARIAEL